MSYVGYSYVGSSDAGGGGNVSVNLTGIQVSAAQGSIAESISLAISGQALTFSQGTVTVGSSDVSVSLTGSALSLSAGTLAPSVAASLSGNQSAFTQGALTEAVAVSLSGASSAFSQGQPVASVSAGLSGASASFAQGSVSTGNDTFAALSGASSTFSAGTPSTSISVSLSGSSASLATGTVAPAVATGIAGQQVASAAGTARASVAVALAGNESAFAQGSVTIPGDVSVSLTGQQIAFEQGSVSVPSTSGGGGYDTKKKRRFIQRVGDKIVVFTDATAALRALDAETSAPVETPQEIAVTAPKRVIPKPEQVEERISIAEIRQAAHRFDQERRVLELFRQQKYAETLALYRAIQIQQEMEDEEALLMLI